MGYASFAENTYDAEAVIRRFGQADHQVSGRPRKNSWKIRYLERLIALQGFPQPLPLLVGTRLVDDRVYMRSQWLRAAVDQWFTDRTPPGAVALTDIVAQRDGTRSMDERAAALGLQLVTGGRAS